MDSLKTAELFCRRHFRKWKSMVFQALLFSAFFAFMELFFHITEELDFTSRFIYPILFSLPLGCFFTGIYSFFSEKINCILSTVTACLTSVWFCTQICYSSVFMTYMETTKMTMAGDAAEHFGGEMKDAIISNIPEIIALALVTAVFSLVLFVYLKPAKKSPVLCGTASCRMCCSSLFCRFALSAGGSGQYSPSEMYRQYPRILDNNVENFGVLTSLRLELCDMVFGHASENKPGFETLDPDILTPSTKPNPEVTEPIHGDETQSGDNTTYIPPEPVKLKNVLDIDMESLIAQETDSKLLSIHEYVASQSGSYTNEYTGMFEGYNLIMICAESFTSHMISEELTPTLYKMSTNGFVFNNYYGTFKSVTTNGEYAFCTGLMPNTVGKVDDLKKNSTFLVSSDKYMPYCMGNVFTSFGASTFAYHSNSSSYYKRGITHPNMGYRFCRFLDGSYVDGVFTKESKLVFSTGRKVPNSDEETALQTLNDYLGMKDEKGNVKQFHAYYMTYSGHHPYYDIKDTEHTKSPMSYENREKVDGLSYSEVVKSYLAANLEVENMLTAILNALEEAGCLENTVIVLTNDHYPYGLLTNQFNELAGKKVDTTFGIYQNSFICYNAGMKNPVVVDTPCCTVDILPTLLNLFGVDYDSRLLAGTDILDENSFHIAMLYNQSFITDKIKYDTKKGKTTYIVDKEEVSEAYIDACISYVKNKFEISLQVVNNDYYKVIYDFIESQKNSDLH